MQQINPKLLNEWKKEGEIITIWECNKCFKKIPFYKTDNLLVNSIYLSFAKFEEYCLKCLNKMNSKQIPKKKVRREIILLRRYEGIIIEEDSYF